MTRFRLFPVVAATLAVTLAGCADDPTTSAAQGPRATWEGAGVDSYTMKIERMCFCADLGPYVVTVSDGEVTSVALHGEPVALDDEMLGSWPLTVDELFDEATAPADDVVVSYDPDLGYPARIAIDRWENAIDDEVTYVVRRLDVADGG